MKTLEELQAEVSNGEVMTAEEFAECLEGAYICDYDGSGYYHDSVSRVKSVPLSFRADDVRQSGYPYVLWFNR